MTAGDPMTPLPVEERDRMVVERRRRCKRCGRLVPPLAGGLLAKHYTDHDGPGLPYPCPGGKR